ncbi:nitroreductase [Aquamicrobium lusatiense]|uniref:Putative NAD(P)H nitroreductase n=1 Tax=Aquamicrobium lusatiense TaxID=89772 RepID=A0A7W9VW04_9HYPH|nr:nitroreductase [Aquamicrobium lusatiense]MBB6012632.1 nitroreductase [Aquamicrobium lusatiense]
MNETIMDFLLTRTSVPVQDLKAPGPDDAQIAKIIAAASRVPDHGKLAPWRFIIYRGEAREEVGRRLVALAEELEGPLPEGRRMKEQTRFSRAPVVIGVVSTPKHHPSIPDWEKFLSGGMAAMNLMIAANALGFGTNLITNWYSDSPEGRAVLGLAPDERVVGFVHIGSFDGPVQDRPRPDPVTLYADYTGPWQG